MWTKIYYLEKMDNKFIECGNYRCYVTNNKTELRKSDIVAFNPMEGKGKNIFSIRKMVAFDPALEEESSNFTGATQ